MRNKEIIKEWNKWNVALLWKVHLNVYSEYYDYRFEGSVYYVYTADSWESSLHNWIIILGNNPHLWLL